MTPGLPKTGEARQQDAGGLSLGLGRWVRTARAGNHRESRLGNSRA